ncbi:UNVERIFIED_CONTAM: Transmembrane protein 62, partial [Siphonaria sp. JEL0065]
MKLLLSTLLVWAYAFSLYARSRYRLGVSSSASTPSSTTDLPPAFQDLAPNPDSTDNVFTWIQISDIHISRSNPTGGLPHFASFLQHELPALAPKLLILSGDLVDAKTPSKLISKQFLDEWQAYSHLLNASSLNARTDFFFDQRGNHDCFDVDLFGEGGVKETPFGKFSRVKEEGW